MSNETEFLNPINKNDPAIYEIVKDAYLLAHAPGELEQKYKYIISMVVDAILVHPDGVAACADNARRAGATQGQITEALRIAFLGGGLSALFAGLPGYEKSQEET